MVALECWEIIVREFRSSEFNHKKNQKTSFDLFEWFVHILTSMLFRSNIGQLTIRYCDRNAQYSEFRMNVMQPFTMLAWERKDTLNSSCADNFQLGIDVRRCLLLATGVAVEGNDCCEVIDNTLMELQLELLVGTAIVSRKEYYIIICLYVNNWNEFCVCIKPKSDCSSLAKKHRIQGSQAIAIAVDGATVKLFEGSFVAVIKGSGNKQSGIAASVWNNHFKHLEISDQYRKMLKEQRRRKRVFLMTDTFNNRVIDIAINQNNEVSTVRNVHGPRSLFSSSKYRVQIAPVMPTSYKQDIMNMDPDHNVFVLLNPDKYQTLSISPQRLHEAVSNLHNYTAGDMPNTSIKTNILGAAASMLATQLSWKLSDPEEIAGFTFTSCSVDIDQVP